MSSKTQPPGVLAIADAVSVGGYQLHMFDKEPMIQDLHLADRLGYSRPTKIRDLIKRMLDKGQLKPDQVFTTVGKTSNGGRQSISYHLSEKACIKVITRSETTKSDEITDEVIDVFIAARLGEIRELTTAEQYARLFLEMASLNPATPGFYSMLTASAEMLLACMGKGMPFDQHSIALISVGQRWKKKWDRDNLELIYGKAKKYKQQYPECFPQALVNGYMEVWHYPTGSREVFEMWLTSEYLPIHYPKYLDGKIKQGVINLDVKVRLLEAMNDRFITYAS